jgi:hypothetical protein
MKTAKQDRQGASTPAGYNRSFAEIMGVALDAQKSVKDGNKLIKTINAAAEVIRITANRFELKSDNLSITYDGTITAWNAHLENAYIKGEIHATSGIIGGCQIKDGKLDIEDITANGIKISGEIVGDGIKSVSADEEYTTLVSGGTIKFGGKSAYAIYAPRKSVDSNVGTAFLGAFAAGEWTTLYLDKATGCVKFVKNQ